MKKIRRRELINLTLANNTKSDFTIPLFQQGVSSINATLRYTWDLTGGDLSCGSADITINGIKYYVTYDTTLSGLANALTNLGFGFFSYEDSGGSYVYTADDTNIYGEINICNTTTTTTSTSTSTTTVPVGFVQVDWSLSRAVGGGAADLVITDVFNNILVSATSTAVVQTGTLYIAYADLPYTASVTTNGVAGTGFRICDITDSLELYYATVPDTITDNQTVNPTPLHTSVNVIYGGTPPICPVI